MKTLKKRNFSYGVFVLLMLMILNTVSTLFARELVITDRRSEMSNWCWAAVSQMVLSWYTVNKTQTEIVQRVYVLPEDETLPLYGSVGYLGVTVAYGYTSISGSLSEIKAHEHVVLQNLQINSNANVTFRAGSIIDIKEGVNIENGAVANLIVDSGIRY